VNDAADHGLNELNSYVFDSIPIGPLPTKNERKTNEKREKRGLSRMALN
jgi:hypothetical protein